MIEHAGWRTEILERLDAAAEDFTFPGPPNLYHPHALLRLHAFRSDAEWLLLLEEVSFARREGCFISGVYGFGSRLDNDGFLGSRDILESSGSELLDDDFRLAVDPLTPQELSINGQRITVELSAADLEQAGGRGQQSPAPETFLRAVVSKVRDAFYRHDVDLLALAGRPGLVKVAQLDEWHQPQVADGELPSEIDCFVSLAEVLAKGEGTIRCDAPNTDWRNWVDGVGPTN